MRIDHPAPAPPVAAGRPRVALVLGAGGLKCVAAVGLWRVLARERIPIDVAVGCSGGALYAAAVALGREQQWAEERTREMWRDLFSRFHYRSIAHALLPRAFGAHAAFGIVDDRRLNAAVRDLYGDATFADTRIPLHIATTDFTTGARHTVQSGRITDAIRASVAIPLLLRPWPIDGRLLVDGGASNPLPVDVAIREGCDIILAMGFEDAMADDLDSLAGMLRRTTAIVQNHLLRATFAFYNIAHHAEVIPLIPQFDRKIGLKDTSVIPYLLDEGEKAAEEQLPYLRRVLAALPATT